MRTRQMMHQLSQLISPSFFLASWWWIRYECEQCTSASIVHGEREGGGVQNLYAASIGISPSKVPRLCGCVATDDKEEDDEEDNGEAR